MWQIMNGCLSVTHRSTIFSLPLMLFHVAVVVKSCKKICGTRFSHFASVWDELKNLTYLHFSLFLLLFMGLTAFLILFIGPLYYSTYFLTYFLDFQQKIFNLS